MPFTFNLQPLLEIRERTEDERKREYAAGVADHQRIVAAFEAMQVEYDSTVARLRANMMKADPRAMEDGFAEATYMRELLIQAREAVEGSEERLTDLRNALLEATKEKNVLEKLKERRKKAYDEARRLREEEEIDDANVIRTSNVATMRRESENL